MFRLKRSRALPVLRWGVLRLRARYALHRPCRSGFLMPYKGKVAEFAPQPSEAFMRHLSKYIATTGGVSLAVR